MKATIKIEKEVEIKTLKVTASEPYWEDATVNGIEDVDGDRMPCRVGNNWCPVIDIDTGIITNWIKGVTAEIHYKICDSGSYFLTDENGDVVLAIENDYVPSIMCPEGNGYGDYIKMKVDEYGQIANWVPLINDFFEED
jgi:hypothetical protein